MIKTRILAGVAALALLTAPAVAKTLNIGALTPISDDPETLTGFAGGSVTHGKSFSYDIAFALPTTAATWTLSGALIATTTALSDETLALYKGAVGSGTLLSEVAFTGSILTDSMFGLGGGDYYLAYAGKAATSGAWSIGLSAVDPTPVPEVSTWAMLGLGFAGFGFLGLGRRKEARYAI